MPTWQKKTETIKKVVNDPLAAIYNESNWKLYKVSPMHDLQYNAVKLKQYGSKIKQEVVSGVEGNLNIKYTVKLEVQPYLKYSEEDANGLMITVSSTALNLNTTKIRYSALLLSWGLSIALDDATHLPYLLERGEQKIGIAVKSILQTMFDCSIVQYDFTQNQLLHFGFSFLEYDTSKDDEAFTLVFTTPQVQEKDKLKISFQMEDIRLIWNGVKEEVAEPSKLIISAYHMILNQINHSLAWNISEFDLITVILPKAEVKNRGIVKLKTPEMINCMFVLLNQMSEFCTLRDLDQNESNDGEFSTLQDPDESESNDES